MINDIKEEITMSKNVPVSEMKLAENMAIDIQRKIQMHYIRNCMSGGFIQAEVLVPMTENVNMEFKIYVPKEIIDEDTQHYWNTLRHIFINLKMANT